MKQPIIKLMMPSAPGFNEREPWIPYNLPIPTRLYIANIYIYIYIHIYSINLRAWRADL